MNERAMYASGCWFGTAVGLFALKVVIPDFTVTDAIITMIVSAVLALIYSLMNNPMED
jgi:hypothetical protein